MRQRRRVAQPLDLGRQTLRIPCGLVRRILDRLGELLARRLHFRIAGDPGKKSGSQFALERLQLVAIGLGGDQFGQV